MTSQIPVERMVSIMVQKIAPKHFDEIRPYIHLKYLKFREKLIKVFDKLDTIHAKLQELSEMVQYLDESIAEYMHQVRMFVIRLIVTFNQRSKSENSCQNLFAGYSTRSLPFISLQSIRLRF